VRLDGEGEIRVGTSGPDWCSFPYPPAGEGHGAAWSLGITFVAYSPLHRGLLTGKIRTEADLPTGDWRGSVPMHVPLDEADLAALDAAFPIGCATGNRYPDQAMASVGREAPPAS
jgi:hypothetical protein